MDRKWIKPWLEFQGFVKGNYYPDLVVEFKDKQRNCILEYTFKKTQKSFYCQELGWRITVPNFETIKEDKEFLEKRIKHELG